MAAVEKIGFSVSVKIAGNGRVNRSKLRFDR